MAEILLTSRANSDLADNVIFYCVTESGIQIVRVLSGERDIESLFRSASRSKQRSAATATAASRLVGFEGAEAV